MISIRARLRLPSGLAGLRRGFFSGPFDGFVTIVFALLFALVVWKALDWAILRAVWATGANEACRADGAGACWSVIASRWRLIIFGLYPYDLQWRSALACMAIFMTASLSCVPRFWTAARLTLIWIAGYAAFYILMQGGVLGLSYVSIAEWGGLSLTVFVFASVALLGMPMAIALALMRRSEMPVIAKTTALIIDVVRSLPLLAILFTAAVVLPLVLPGWMQSDKLYRVIFAFALFFACYQAEIIRGGMQAASIGQEEAAKALGIGYWHRMSRIVLPQAFRAALPPTINQIVVTFMDTSVIVIIGFFEVMASGAAAYGSGEWSFAYVEVYVFVGLIYFSFSFLLSRYGAFLERRHALATK